MSLLTPITAAINPPILVPSIVSPPVASEDVFLIQSGILTNQSQFVITDLSADYIKYVLFFAAAASVTNASTDFGITTSIDNGTSFQTGANTYAYRVQRSSGSDGNTTHFAGTWNQAELISGISNVSGNYLSGSVEIFDPMDGSIRTTILTRSGGMINADGITSNFAFLDITAQREAAEANDALRFFVTTGNFSMKYALYGYK